MTLKLEVGKTYETRGGTRVTIRQRKDNGYYQGDLLSYAEDGHAPGMTRDCHLVREVTETPALRLEVGKTYASGYGESVTIVKQAGKLFRGDNQIAYYSDGTAPGMSVSSHLHCEVPPEEPCKHDACECGKEKFGFLMHERWCPEWYHPSTPTVALTMGTPEPAPDYITDGDRRAMREKAQ